MTPTTPPSSKSAKQKVERLRTLLSRILGIATFISCFFFYNFWDSTPGLKPFATCFYSLGIALAGIGAMGRVWCSVYIAGYKTQKLVIAGPYSMTRNPLYFFSLIGAIGVGLTSETLTIPLLIIIAFALYYPSVIRAEEGRLATLHGEDYQAYCKRVPLFFPKLSLLTENENYTVNARIIREHLVSAIWFVWAPIFFELIESLHEMGLPYFFTLI